jgi:hypothetical protein
VITGSRSLAGGSQHETEKVVGFLKTGAWVDRPNKRNARRKHGASAPAARKAADAELVALMREHPKAGVRALAAMLGMSHGCVSRRIGPLKAAGVVCYGPDGWTVETPATFTAWVKPIATYTRTIIRDEADAEDDPRRPRRAKAMPAAVPIPAPAQSSDKRKTFTPRASKACKNHEATNTPRLILLVTPTRLDLTPRSASRSASSL